MNPREYLDILHTAEKLKDTLRHCTTTNRRPESVAEHSWRTALMAMLLRDEFPDADTGKIIRMCLIRHRHRVSILPWWKRGASRDS